MHTVLALLCFAVVIHWLIFPYPLGLLHWHCGKLTIAPVPAKQPWWIWINTSCEFIMNDCITTTKQSTTKPCAYFLGYTVYTEECGESKLTYQYSQEGFFFIDFWVLFWIVWLESNWIFFSNADIFPWCLRNVAHNWFLSYISDYSYAKKSWKS